MMANGKRGGIKPTGTGRIVLWRGGSIWIGNAEEGTDFHAHHAIQVTLALSGGVVRFRSAGENWNAYKAAVVTAHQSHAFDSRGELVALIFAEPESLEGRAIQERYSKGISSLADYAFEQESAALAAAYHGGAADAELAAYARAVISKLGSSHALPVKPLDPRIERAITVLRERLGEAVTMAEIAAAVHLSPERFRHLFLKETGIRFRPYLLWLRLELAVASYAAGNSLTEASYAGGFADSAHFSRTFRRMFGVAAISVRRE
jgi:AraC-like DNA-binding protein